MGNGSVGVTPPEYREIVEESIQAEGRCQAGKQPRLLRIFQRGNTGVALCVTGFSRQGCCKRNDSRNRNEK